MLALRLGRQWTAHVRRRAYQRVTRGAFIAAAARFPGTTSLGRPCRRCCGTNPGASTRPDTRAPTAAAADDAAHGLTPMMKQWNSLKTDPRLADHLVLFQCGEFYELFHDDAVRASNILGITLTKRKSRGRAPIPMCGVPVATRDTHVARLVRAGVRVVVCDQAETKEAAEKRGTGSLVRRAVTRVITPGTLTETALLQPGAHTYLAALWVTPASPRIGLAWYDVSTGAFQCRTTTVDLLHSELAAHRPAELLVPESVWNKLHDDSDATWDNEHAVRGVLTSLGSDSKQVVGLEGTAVTVVPNEHFSTSPAAARSLLTAALHARAADTPRRADWIKTLSAGECRAAEAVLRYVRWTQGLASDELPTVLPRFEGARLDSAFLRMDPFSRRSLEIEKPVDGKRRGFGSLLREVDRCVTPQGSRLVSDRLLRPSTDVVTVDGRLDTVQWLVERRDKRRAVRLALRQCGDIERSVQRIAMGRGTPQDLAAVRDSLLAAADVSSVILPGLTPPLALDDAELASVLLQRAAQEFDQQAEQPRLAPHAVVGGTHDSMPEPLLACALLCAIPAASDAHECGRVLRLLQEAVVEDPPTSVVRSARESRGRNGPVLRRSAASFVRPGYDTTLDGLWDMAQSGDAAVAEILTSCRAALDVPANALKISHTAEHGYTLEVPHRFADVVAAHPDFHHTKTLKNTRRFKTPALAELDTNAVVAQARVVQAEQALFKTICKQVLREAPLLTSVARALAVLDVSSSLAEVACDRGFSRPTFVEDDKLTIHGGRHAVVESGLFPVLRGSTDALPRRLGGFVANSVELEAASSVDLSSPAVARAWLLTGPNMGGKSTLLRQTAHVVVLAQMGSYVPASDCTLGVVDQVFSRVGAADDLAGNRSTFMCEMQETASILNKATARSLVIVDEIGRGTSSSDGLAIAWAVLEHLVTVTQCKTLFATHFHALASLTDVADSEANGTVNPRHVSARLPGLVAKQMGFVGTPEGPSMTFRVKPGVAPESYGLHVAKLAGLPNDVVDRAYDIMSHIQESEADLL